MAQVSILVARNPLIRSTLDGVRKVAEFETNAESAEASEHGDKESLAQRSKGLLDASLRRLVLFVSFGPGVLGFLWLIGRILKPSR